MDLPDGTALEVNLRALDDEDDLDAEERERLCRALDEGIESVRAGRTVDAKDAVRRLLSQSSA